ncbi:MAG: hypothetical protein EOO53_17500 [Gammaproteobacteria bacterium]|nr:MAG: hypothetical protein EOO53_17500 [Gammaproteobacteria bacterium]
MRKFIKPMIIIAAIASTPMVHAAAATDLPSLIANISFTDVISTIFGVGATAIGIDLAIVGYLKVRKIVRGA